MDGSRLRSMMLLMTLLAAWCWDTASAKEKYKSSEPPRTDTITGTTAEGTPDYKELLNRNLFSRNQRRRPDYSNSVVPDHETANELARAKEKAKEADNKGEADIVLMGTLEKDGVASAFLEDRKAGKAIAAKTGDAIAGGKVGVITVGAMEFIVGDKTTKILMGSNLQGGVSSAKPLDPTSTGSTVSSTGGANGGAGGADDPNLSIIEKLRRKRQKELNR